MLKHVRGIGTLIFALGLFPINAGAECKTIMVCENEGSACHYDNVKEVYLALNPEEPELHACE